MQHFPVEVVHDVQEPVGPSIPQAVCHKIYAPYQIGLLGLEKGLLDPGRYSPLPPETDIEFQGRVDAVHTLVIPCVTHPAQAEVGLPEANRGMLLHKLMQA